jgi:hypothetical protein
MFDQDQEDLTDIEYSSSTTNIKFFINIIQAKNRSNVKNLTASAWDKSSLVPDC